MADLAKTQIPKVIAALHLPRHRVGDRMDMPRLEEYALANMALFAQGGMPAVILQDRSFNDSHAHPETMTMMAVLGRLLRFNYPQVELGIIIEAHDPVASLAIAQACGASFVRLKVFVGAMVKAGGTQQACGVQAVDYRNCIGRNDIKILADVHDRTGVPLVDVPLLLAAGWAANVGADALVLTGSTYDESLEFLQSVRASGVTRPLYMGGSVSEQNVQQVLKYANGTIVSSSLKKDGATSGDLLQWDLDKIKRFMDVVSQGS
jgi:uncharacterized protein